MPTNLPFRTTRYPNDVMFGHQLNGLTDALICIKADRVLRHDLLASRRKISSSKSHSREARNLTPADSVASAAGVYP